MRIALITEAAYPFRRNGASSWCHQLVAGLGQYQYRLVALTGPTDQLVPAYPLPRNLAGVSPVPVHGPPVTVPGRLARHRTRRAATRAAVLLCRGLLGDDPHHAGMFRDGLVQLAGLAAGGAHPLTGTPLADVLVDAWRAAGRAVGSSSGPGARPSSGPSSGPGPGIADRPAGRLSLRDAEAAAVLLEHALRPLAVPAPPVDLCHPASGGLPLLVALAARWRAGIPYLLSEQGIYLRERYLDYRGQWPSPVKEVMLRFFGALSRLGYAEAALVVAATRFAQRWQLRHGADPAKVLVVPGGVDPAGFPARAPDPTGATVTWVGRIEPLKDLHTLVHAFWRVHRELPAARLRLVGPTADQQYEETCRALVRRLGLTSVVSFAGPLADPADAYATAQLVARSSISEGMPYPVVEAMMTGRATVCTDVGGVAELVGDTGLLVPPADPAALAAGLVGLLRDPARRRTLGAAAADRARGLLTLDRMLRAYDFLYQDAAAETGAGAARSRLGRSLVGSSVGEGAG